MGEGRRRSPLLGSFGPVVPMEIPLDVPGREMVWVDVRIEGVKWSRLRWTECLLEDFGHVGGLEAQNGKRKNSGKMSVVH